MNEDNSIISTKISQTPISISSSFTSNSPQLQTYDIQAYCFNKTINLHDNTLYRIYSLSYELIFELQGKNIEMVILQIENLRHTIWRLKKSLEVTLSDLSMIYKLQILYIDRGISRNLGICRFIKAVIKKPVDKNIETIKILEQIKQKQRIQNLQGQLQKLYEDIEQLKMKYEHQVKMFDKQISCINIAMEAVNLIKCSSYEMKQGQTYHIQNQNYETQSLNYEQNRC